MISNANITYATNTSYNTTFNTDNYNTRLTLFISYISYRFFFCFVLFFLLAFCFTVFCFFFFVAITHNVQAYS